jgi:HD-like signal output (HDOD) protein
VEKPTPQPAAAGIDSRFVKRLPAFSPVAVRLLSVLSDEIKSFKEVARLIALDPILAGEVLRLANSGLYGRRFEVRSVLQAIALLGIGRINQLAVTAALWRGLPRRTSPFVREWWRHSIASALIAQRCNQDGSSGITGDFAYTAGLLHGVGQLALFQDSPDAYPELVERACTEGVELLVFERAASGVDHASLAGIILESWGLPQDLVDAAARHHQTSSGSRVIHSVQIGCVGAEFAGFGRCGCHQHLAQGIPVPIEELFRGDYPLAALMEGVNQIECSLL